MTETLSGFWNSSWKTIINAIHVFYVEYYQYNVFLFLLFIDFNCYHWLYPVLTNNQKIIACVVKKPGWLKPFIKPLLSSKLQRKILKGKIEFVRDFSFRMSCVMYFWRNWLNRNINMELAIHLSLTFRLYIKLPYHS